MKSWNMRHIENLIHLFLKAWAVWEDIGEAVDGEFTWKGYVGFLHNFSLLHHFREKGQTPGEPDEAEGYPLQTEVVWGWQDDSGPGQKRDHHHPPGQWVPSLWLGKILENSMFSVRKQYYSINFSAHPRMNCWLGHSSFTIPNSVCFLSVKRLWNQAKWLFLLISDKWYLDYIVFDT